MIVKRESDPDGVVDRTVEELNPAARDAGTAGMRVANKRVSRREHVDGIARQRRQGMRHRRDDSDHAERRVVRKRDAV